MYILKNSFIAITTENIITYAGSEGRSFGMLDIEVILFGRAMLILNLAFSAGSSKHGNALRASVGWNCVVAIHLYKDQIFRLKLYYIGFD